MPRETIIRTNDGTGVAILRFRDFLTPSWSPVKADYYIPACDLALIVSGVTTSGRYFTDRFACSSDGRYLAIEEMEFDGSQDSIDRHSSKLILVDVSEGLQATIGRIEDGYSFPKRVEGGSVFYSKSRRTEKGVEHEYERTIASIRDWTKIGEQGAAVDAGGSPLPK